MLVPENTSGPPNMLANLFRQSFWAVFVPLLLAAGLFWMDELRGYQGEMSLLVLPKADLAQGAAANLAALARETSFATLVYEAVGAGIENPLIGRTPAERRAIWKEAVTVRVVGTSDVIRIASLGDDQDDALALAETVAAELVRTASRYYNQKTDLDIRIVADPVAIPSLSAWPRFAMYSIGTAFFFTLLFFTVYGLIERIFPKRSVPQSGGGEYVISPETFKPQKPAYWGHTEAVFSQEVAPSSAEPIQTVVETIEVAPTEGPVMPEDEDESATKADSFTESAIAPETWPTDLPIEEPLTEETFTTEAYQPSYEAERAGLLDEDAPSGYVTHAAAPDNLPIIEGAITPLQGAQSRLMKADIDATAGAYAAMTESVLEAEPLKPQTHEPTPEEYRRRLNELLSGKM